MANKELLYVIEPVIESLIQLLVQSILVYIVLGPSDSIDGNNSGVNFKGLWNMIWQRLEISAPSAIDISSTLFESTTERLLYVVQLASSFFSVCISFTKWAMTNSYILHNM